ncbi:MAG TPA: hypothetical protein VFQ35_25155 [Polyangiaceae bacterium]|nr:hypothetical protein [Polyangiaceae bacterium]
MNTKAAGGYAGAIGNHSQAQNRASFNFGPRRSSLAVGAGGFGVVALLAFVAWRSTSLASPSKRDGDSRLSELQSSARANERAIAQLEQELRATKLAAAHAESNPKHAASEVPPIASAAVAQPERAPEPAAPPHTPAQENQFFGDYFAELDTMMQHEGVDVAWSREISKVVQEAYGRQNLQGSKLTRIECGKTLCRVESEHASEKARELFKMTFVGSLGGRFERFTLHAPMDALTTTTFMAKTGAVLPSHRDLGIPFPGEPE